ncbi:MAG: DNA-binding protein [Planctomycetota bacterium]|nr:MAG: DNA-binding protein [Planctomycetota bacterium]
MDQSYLSLNEAAELLKVDYKTLYRLVRQGRIPSFRVGRIYRIHRQDLDSFMSTDKGLKEKEPESKSSKKKEDGTWICCLTGKEILWREDLGGFHAESGHPIHREAWEIYLAGAKLGLPPSP